MDRIDVFVEVPAVKYEKLTEIDEKNSSQIVRKRVQLARQIQKERFQFSRQNKEKILTNSEMSIPQIKKYCQIDYQSQVILKKYVNSGKLTARGYHRVLKMARTIADLDGKDAISYDHLTEALMYRLREES